MQGILLVDKPEGWTSFDVVNYIRRIVANFEEKKPRNIKVGHSGTLDPFATGLLIIMIGKEYTRKAELYTKLDKSYEAVIQIGEESETGDSEGEIRRISTKQPTIEEITSVTHALTGTIMQTPPVYSAIKINGKRAYDLARAGKHVEIKAREVCIYKLDIMSYEYPALTIRCSVSSGTYIRSLATTIGEKLETGAYTKTLRRLTIGKYSINDATTVKNLDAQKIQDSVIAHD